MSSLCEIKNTNNLGAYNLKDYKVKMIDRVEKCLILTARNKPDLIENITGYANYDLCEDERPEYLPRDDKNDWFFEQVDEKWNLDLWKPIRVEERLEVSGAPGLGKIAYKHKFWLKKIVVKYIWENEPGSFEKPSWNIYHSFAVCYDKSKNGEYTIVDDQLNSGIVCSSEWEDYKEGGDCWNERCRAAWVNQPKKYIELVH